MTTPLQQIKTKIDMMKEERRYGWFDTTSQRKLLDALERAVEDLSEISMIKGLAHSNIKSWPREELENTLLGDTYRSRQALADIAEILGKDGG